MAAAAKMDAAVAGEAPAAEDAKQGGRKKLLLILLPVLILAGTGAGLWSTGILLDLLGMNSPPAAEARAEPAPPPRSPPAFVELPEIIANLNAPGRRPVFVRLRAKLEISKAEDSAAVTEAMPRLLDLFQTYLREVRPEELRGSAGTHRLREELIARATLAASPARITDVLFMEMLIQ